MFEGSRLATSTVLSYKVSASIVVSGFRVSGSTSDHYILTQSNIDPVAEHSKSKKSVPARLKIPES